MVLGFQTGHHSPVTVKVEWDAEASVWYTEDSNLPGLNLEAETIEGLVGKLFGAIEDLTEGKSPQEVQLIVPPGAKFSGIKALA